MIDGSPPRTEFTGKLRYGMVGGGPGAFIGDVHRRSIALDEMALITAGCFSRSFENTLSTGTALGIDRDRLYGTFEEMAEAEGNGPGGIDFAVIVTPNVSHYPAVRAFLRRGIPVVCDKPLCFTESQAMELTDLAKSRDLLFCVTYTYTGFPAVKHAREMIRHGEIGEVIYVAAEYPQDWLISPQEKEGNRQAQWRTDPQWTGNSNCVGDIGSHIENIISYVTGLKIKSVLARLDRLGPGRVLDDNATILVEYEGGAKGVYWSSQMAAGYDNGLQFRIFGRQGSLEWRVEDPNYLRVSLRDKPRMVLSRGRDSFYPRAQAFSRIPAGHPEGYFEALANIYKTYMGALIKQRAGETPEGDDLDFPNGQDGLNGVRFINACVESSRQGAVWITF
ncbi:MAG: Gfo/Idh/MocA family oxidoreductase [Spirochaetaceae bacterium]|jgi:predicted dehydrogenase|nr:Gfo/Idh/MocA family oxidoreductase [Spirochaetaceae bacterium]